MLARSAAAARRVARIHTSVVHLQDAAKAAASSGAAKPLVDPSDPEIAPSIPAVREWKNEYYRKRGFKVADKSWTEWTDIPKEAGIFRYLGVKVDPAHVTEHGLLWKWFSDWRTAIPTGVLLSLPLWMFNILPPFDERMELACIGLATTYSFCTIAGPMIAEYKESRVGQKVKMLLDGEKDLNNEISTSIAAYKAGGAIVENVKALNDAERSLRALEAQAATKRVLSAQRDALVQQLDYLVQVSASGAADKESAVVKSARAIVEKSLEDASLQQRTIESAIKALKEGSVSEDIVTPLFAKAVEKAKADEASKAVAKPLTNALQIDIFRKRFGLTEDAVTEATLARAKADKAAWNVLKGKVGGKEPAVGLPYVLKPAIAYAK